MANGDQNIGDQHVLVVLCMVTKNEFGHHRIGNKKNKITTRFIQNWMLMKV